MAGASSEFHLNKRRRVSDVSPAASAVKQQGAEHKLKWETIAPVNIAAWFEVYAKANNTTRDILLASVLPTVACLMGQTTIKVESRLKSEQVNLFMICLCAPGSGKSPAFQNGCSQPVRLHVEEQKSTNLFVDEFTEAGLFQQLKGAMGHKAIVGKEELSQFMEAILGGERKKAKIDMERLIQLYDGATWVYTKGNQSARQVINNPGVSIVGYSQPERFFPLYCKLKERRDGAVDRMLLYQPKPHRLTAAETKDEIQKLNQYSLKDLRQVYEDIYSFCHPENDVVALELDERGNNLFEAFSDEMAATLNKQWEENRTDEDVSKEDRHVLRLAAVLHVVYDQIEKRLNREAASPPSFKVGESTLKRAIRLAKYFTEQRKILDQLVHDNTSQELSSQNATLAQSILKSPGPFATVQVVQKAMFNGKNRPSATVVIEVMGNLEKDGLGMLRKQDRTSVFLKKLPCHVKEDDLQAYGVEPESFREQFQERAPLELLSRDLFNKILRMSPKKDELSSVYFIDEEL